MGRKGPREKTKTVLKSVRQGAKFGTMQNLKFQTLHNKNPPNALCTVRHSRSTCGKHTITIGESITQGTQCLLEETFLIEDTLT